MNNKNLCKLVTLLFPWCVLIPEGSCQRPFASKAEEARPKMSPEAFAARQGDARNPEAE